MILIYGGSGSGKSAYAEKWVMEHKNPDGVCYYLATMAVYDKEGEKRVEKHRLLREGKGFVTVEYQRNIEDMLNRPVTKQDTVLLECLSNLAANEMFCYEKNEMQTKDAETVVKHIMEGILQIHGAAGQLCIVGNDIFREGGEQTPEMACYMKAMGKLQRTIAGQAQQVIEVVYGVPVTVCSRESL